MATELKDLRPRAARKTAAPKQSTRTRAARPPSKVASVRAQPANAKPPKAKAIRALSAKPRIPDGWAGGVRILGIDPGKHTGLAYFEDGQLISMRECKPHLLRDVLRNLAPMVALVVFEDSRAAKTVWTSEGTLAKRLKMARNVGEIDGLCNTIQETCADFAIPCAGLPPSSKAGSATGKKITAEQFQKFTGHTEPSNEHKRDAALIAWNYRRLKP